MAVRPFVRARNISSTLVLRRIEVKRGIYAKRRMAIKREIEKLSAKLAVLGSRPRAEVEARMRSLEVEDRAIVVFENELEEAFRSERAAMDLRAKRRVPIVPDPPVVKPAASRISRSIILQAGAGSAVARYDQSLCLFKASNASLVGDRSAKPIGDGSEGDALLDRLISLVDVPGLAHMALLTERRQEVLDISSDDILPAAIGLPAAEAFVDHSFSADAFSTFSDLDVSRKFFMDLIAADLKPSR